MALDHAYATATARLGWEVTRIELESYFGGVAWRRVPPSGPGPSCSATLAPCLATHGPGSHLLPRPSSFRCLPPRYRISDPAPAETKRLLNLSTSARRPLRYHQSRDTPPPPLPGGATGYAPCNGRTNESPGAHTSRLHVASWPSTEQLTDSPAHASQPPPTADTHRRICRSCDQSPPTLSPGYATLKNAAESTSASDSSDTNQRPSSASAACSVSAQESTSAVALGDFTTGSGSESSSPDSSRDAWVVDTSASEEQDSAEKDRETYEEEQVTLSVTDREFPPLPRGPSSDANYDDTPIKSCGHYVLPSDPPPRLPQGPASSQTPTSVKAAEPLLRTRVKVASKGGIVHARDVGRRPAPASRNRGEQRAPRDFYAAQSPPKG
ncbi:hypothetical protein MRX96_032361 [Rhipicephalus microplus]